MTGTIIPMEDDQEDGPTTTATAAMPRPPPSGPALEELLTRKEAEWRALQAHRTQLQDAALKEAQSQLEEAQGQLRRLREDFVYNLQVLEERDRELECCDLAFAQARRQEEARQAEASELKIEVAKLRQALTREARQVEELQQRQRLTLQDHRRELERMHSDRNVEIHHLREQYEQLQGTLGRKLQELDGELALQKQELLLEFESELQRRGHESRLQADTLSNAVLTHELKVKLLRKELEALKGAAAEAAESLQRAEVAIAELEHTVARRDQELQDLEAVKDARIKDLEGKLHAAQLTRAKEEETFRRKHEELDRLARERDAVLASVREAHVEQLRALEARERELQAHTESLETRLRRAEWEQADAAKDHNTAITRLREEASALKSGWDAQVAQLSKEMVSKDLQVHALQEEGLRLTAQSARLQQDIDRYKQQLVAAMGREQSLEREKVQLELDWQRRCDSAERDQYCRSEELIQGLTTGREQVAAKLQETEQRLSAKEELLKALALERDQAVHMLRTHGLLPKQEAQPLPEHHKEEISQDFPSSEIQRLQEQNTSLRNVITQMRKQMETLSDPVPPPADLGGQLPTTSQTNVTTSADTATPDYVLVLKEEIRSLKHKFKTLEEQLQDALDPPKMSLCSAEAQPSTGESPSAGQASLWSLGSEGHFSAGDHPQAEVAPSVLACKKLAGRVRLLDRLVSRLRQKVLQKPPEMDAVRLQLPREVDQVHMEVSELNRQVAELDKHLSTTKKEGGEAEDGKQPQSLETTALWRQVGALPPLLVRAETQGYMRDACGSCDREDTGADGLLASWTSRDTGRSGGAAGQDRQTGCPQGPVVELSFSSQIHTQSCTRGLAWSAVPPALSMSSSGPVHPCSQTSIHACALTVPQWGPARGHPAQHSAELRLQRQLRAAARRIVSLRQQNEQLTEAGNRLRARLGRQGQRGSQIKAPVCSQGPRCSGAGIAVQSCSRITVCRNTSASMNMNSGRHRGPLNLPHLLSPHARPCPFMGTSTACFCVSGYEEEARPRHLLEPVLRKQETQKCALGLPFGDFAAFNLPRAKALDLFVRNLRLHFWKSLLVGGHAGTSSCLSRLPAPETRSPGQEPESPLDRGLPLGQVQPHFTVQTLSRIPTPTCKSAHQKENRSPKLPQAQVLQEAGPLTQRSTSSVASSSLQDTWKLLELSSSPSGPASQENSTPGRKDGCSVRHYPGVHASPNQSHIVGCSADFQSEPMEVHV
ncbi:PREDICTED: coiled-coil domain-containing protein 57 [Chrysochloris asiatica]|uniref:Coiled-coil domain-containing protein 57 n=1 Tax=Chrysochloris asiatica TaxID=185453 RepID=A0A9B0TVW4_CHRAS|nr:PREDICTED: coiled-coil domain-containing protein 57 [Chrysochloris asiatica]